MSFTTHQPENQHRSGKFGVYNMYKMPGSSRCFNFICNRFCSEQQVFVGVYGRELLFPNPVWLVPNILIYYIVDCTFGHLKISGNGPHRHFDIRIYNVLHSLYQLLGLDTVRTLWLHLRFAWGDISPMDASNGFRALCTNDLATLKKKMQSQHSSTLHVLQQLPHIVSYHG